METQTHKTEVKIVFRDILIWSIKVMGNFPSNKWVSNQLKILEVKINNRWTKPQASCQAQGSTWQTLWIPVKMFISKIVSSIFKIKIINLLKAKLWVKINVNITNLISQIKHLVNFNAEILQILLLQTKPLNRVIS